MVDANLTGSGSLTVVNPSAGVAYLGGTGTLSYDLENSYQHYVFQTQLTILDDTLFQAPTSLTLALTDSAPESVVTFKIDGTTVATATTDSEGDIHVLSIPVPESVGLAGSHTLLADVTSPDATDASADFTLERNPTTDPYEVGADADPVEVPEAELSTGVRRWVFQDLMPGGLGSYIFPANPDSADPWPFDRTLTPDHTTAIGGQFHVSEPERETHEWSFKGTSITEDFHDTLRDFAELNRRFYLIDHRNRAWTITIAGTELVPRRRANAAGTLTDWVVDYTVRCVIYDDVWKVPA